MLKFGKYFLIRQEELDICSLIRTLYASIDLTNVAAYEPKNADFANEDELDFLRSIMSSNTDNMKKVLRKLQSAQVDFLGKNATTLEQVTFARGTLNGLALVEEELERLTSIYKKLVAKKEVYDKHDLL